MYYLNHELKCFVARQKIYQKQKESNHASLRRLRRLTWVDIFCRCNETTFSFNMTHYLGCYKLQSSLADMDRYFLQIQWTYFFAKHDTLFLSLQNTVCAGWHYFCRCKIQSVQADIIFVATKYSLCRLTLFLSLQNTVCAGWHGSILSADAVKLLIN